MCGGAAAYLAASKRSDGLSPRVRGSQPRARPQLHRQGSIPACAGEPAMSGLLHRVLTVYPRVCGGAPESSHSSSTSQGLSPRVRGSRSYPRPVEPRRRSIPACAGEPPI